MVALFRSVVLAAMAALLAIQCTVAAPSVVAQPSQLPSAGSFRFISWGDAQGEHANLAGTAKQAAALNPAFTIFNGDLERDGFSSSQMTEMVTAMGGLYGRTFLVRGNHDNHRSGSTARWEDFFSVAARPLPAGVSNYIALDSNSTYLSYSFDVANSRLIGVDVPGDVDSLTSVELAFIDQRLKDAETRGLTHAFLFFHGGEYCIANHCECSAANDGLCTPGGLVNLLNRHRIVSATFHGHEHVLGWVHMSNARVSTLTRSYEEFFTSPAGGSTVNSYVFPARVDYVYPDMGASQGFASVDVNGPSFTVSFYKNGVSSPVYSRTFTKPGIPITASFRSGAAADGQVLESSETSNLGGTADAMGVTVKLGDDAARRQYRAVFSFTTGGLPDDAVLTSATLELTRQVIAPVGTNPFAIFQGLQIDIRNGYFGASSSLQPADFQAGASKGGLLPMQVSTSGAVYRIVLPNAALLYINKTPANNGLTQLRLRFKLDDNNNNIANFISFFSGNYGTAISQPTLKLTYRLP